MSKLNFKVEIPKGSKLKIEEGSLDRLLQLEYPSYYGEVENSKIQPDGDKADFFLISKHPIGQINIPPELLQLYAVLLYEDKGEKDDKYVYYLKGQFDMLKDQFELAYQLQKILSFLLLYKRPQGVINKVSQIYIDSSSPIEGFEHLNLQVYKCDLDRYCREYLLP